MPEATPKTPHDAGDRLPEVLETVFSFKFPFRKQYRAHAKTQQLVGTSPLIFYDRHINESQTLKHVALMPSLADDLRRKVDDRLAELKKNEEGPLRLWHDTRGDFASARIPTISWGGLITPSCFARDYSWTIPTPCTSLTSSWVIHPRAPQYYQTITFDLRGSLYPRREADPFDAYTLRLMPLSSAHSDVLSSIDDMVKGVLRDWSDRDIATWLVLPLSPNNDQVLKDLDRLTALPSIPSPTCRVRGYPINIDSRPTPCDAQTTPWTLPTRESEDEAALETNETPNSGAVAGNDGTIFPTSSRSTFEQDGVPTPEALIHHVWRVSVTHDTTVIVMVCGNYERIGIRHRASRTLYLSNLIDLTNPGYGKLHLGIQMSAVDDALQRYRQSHQNQPEHAVAVKIEYRETSLDRGEVDSDTSQSHKPSDSQAVAAEAETRKRSCSPDDVEDSGPPRKRQKVPELTQVHVPSSSDCSDVQVLWEEVAKRPILLVRCSMNGLNSSIPACCLRKGVPLSPSLGEPSGATYDLQGSYKPSEYFVLTLLSKHGRGATAQVYLAEMEITLPGGHKIMRSVAVKIVLHEEERRRLQHEYEVYKHLWTHKVKRIPEVYGLFEDIDEMATVLVMERVGPTFRQRYPVTKENEGILTDVSSSEKLECISIVQEMHDAGVVHSDLRAENLVYAQDGKPMIIDFDHSTIDATDVYKDHEMGRLRDLLDGRSLDTARFPVVKGLVKQQK
ncbi:hypothetical protein BDN72DRAFT_900312 [Pluteus cervinus]|uniref:Uncharacterized protein n=1 Tax=Pluteus cervinus TaxID=181527 RepID=A0ACD3AJS1_9AGAR|nr:hypothetical protein BDN72DRAFT_900312 [Pluteus cervinus]